MENLVKFERAGVYLDVFYKMEFIREKLLKKPDYSSVSDYLENIKNYNTHSIQSNIVTMTRYFLIVNPLTIKSSFYQSSDKMIIKCQISNNLSCSDEDCKGQPIAQSIFGSKNNIWDPVRENSYKIYIEDINPILENTILKNTSIKNLEEYAINNLIEKLDYLNYHETNDVE